MFRRCLTLNSEPYATSRFVRATARLFASAQYTNDPAASANFCSSLSGRAGTNRPKKLTSNHSIQYRLSGCLCKESGWHNSLARQTAVSRAFGVQRSAFGVQRSETGGGDMRLRIARERVPTGGRRPAHDLHACMGGTPMSQCGPHGSRQTPNAERQTLEPTPRLQQRLGNDPRRN